MTTLTLANTFTGDSTLSATELDANLKTIKDYLNCESGGIDHNNIQAAAGLMLSQVAQKYSLCTVNHIVKLNGGTPSEADRWTYFVPPRGARLREIRVMSMTTAGAAVASAYARLKAKLYDSELAQISLTSTTTGWSHKVYYGDDMPELDAAGFYGFGFEASDLPATAEVVVAQLVFAVPHSTSDATITE